MTKEDRPQLLKMPIVIPYILITYMVFKFNFQLLIDNLESQNVTTMLITCKYFQTLKKKKNLRKEDFLWHYQFMISVINHRYYILTN